MAGYPPSDGGNSALYAGVVPRPDDFDPIIRARRQAEVIITEQPASKALRFRYECEGRSAGSIPGANSTSENKTFPSISVVGYKGAAVVVVSCVTKDPPYRPHPHNLVGKDGCKKGVCTVNLSVETMSVTFQNLGIQCVKKKDVKESLILRESIRVDPFQTGFGHREQSTTIDLNTVRLCFQVFVEGRERGKYVVPLKPVVSDAIFDKKSMCDLAISKLSDCSSSVAGGKDIILLCEKVTKDDIEVRFFEMRDNRLHWEALAEFQPSDVHKQVAIAFKTPRYATLELEAPVRAQVQLRRPSDKQCSESLPFAFTPLDSDGIEEKKRKMARNSHQLERYIAYNVSGNAANFGAPAVSEVTGARPKVKPSAKRIQTIKNEPSDGSQVAMSGGGIVAAPSSYEVHKTQYIRGGGTDGQYIKAEYLYPQSISPGAPVQQQPHYQGYRSPRHPAATPSPGPPAPPPASDQHQLLDMDTQRPVNSAANIELDLAQLNSSDLNMLCFPSELDANQQAIDGHLSSNLSQSLSFLEEPAAAAVGAGGQQDSQMDLINDLEYLNQAGKR